MATELNPIQLSGKKRKVTEAKMDPILRTSKRLEVNPTLAEKEKSTTTNVPQQHNMQSNTDIDKVQSASFLRISQTNNDIDRRGKPNASESGSTSPLLLFQKNDTSSTQVPGNGVDKRVSFHKETNMNRKAKPQPALLGVILPESDEKKTAVETVDLEPSGANMDEDSPKVAKMKYHIKTNIDIESIIELTNLTYHKVAFRCTVLWVFLMCLSYYIGYKTDSLVSLTGVERKAPMVAAMLIGTSVFGTALPLFIRGKMKNISGVLVCAIVVHCVAFATDLLMANFPTPGFLDPVSGTKVYLLRWCEWTPLAFLMTFLTESCRINDGEKAVDHRRTNGVTAMLSAVGRNGDLGLGRSTANKNDRNGAPNGYHGSDDNSFDSNATETKTDRNTETLMPGYFLSWCQGLSTFCGWLFPFCPGPISWTITLIVSCNLYAMMFHRLHRRKLAFKTMQSGSTIAEQEMYHWARLSLGLLTACTAMWTVLVIAFCVYTCGPLVLPETSFVNATGFGMICESIIDVLFKAVYMLIIVDVHDTIFDRSARAERRLEELRQVSLSL